MARKKLPASGKQVNKKSASARGKKWSELKPGTQRKYKAAGVSPQRYNASRAYKGAAREQFLGLKPNQISGLSAESARARAFESVRRVFGDATYSGRKGKWASLNGTSSFNASGTRKFLRDLDKPYLQALAKASDAKIYRWAFEPIDFEDLTGEDTPDDEITLFYH